MRWKKFISYKHHYLSPHHHYQMAVIFLFFFLLLLFIPYHIFTQELNLDMQEYQWYFFIPMTIFYAIYCLVERGRIGEEERVNSLKRPIVHWVLLGISLIALQLHPQENYLEKITALNFVFAVFSLFLADSYWDFKKIKFFRR